MKLPGKTMIKVSSILFIISGVLALAVYLVGTLLFSAATVKTDVIAGWIVVAICVFYTIMGLLELIAGVKGIKGCNSKEAALSLKVWGIIVMIISLFTNVLSGISNYIGGTSSLPVIILGIIMSVLFPVLYIVGASKNANA